MMTPTDRLREELGDLIARDISSEEPKLPEILEHLMAGEVGRARLELGALYLRMGQEINP